MGEEVLKRWRELLVLLCTFFSVNNCSCGNVCFQKCTYYYDWDSRTSVQR